MNREQVNAYIGKEIHEANHNALTIHQLREFTAKAAARMHDAAVKYEITPDLQSFEQASVASMTVGMREEVVDGVNYGGMIRNLLDKNLNLGVIDMNTWNEATEFTQEAMMCLIEAERALIGLSDLIKENGQWDVDDDSDYVTVLRQQTGIIDMGDDHRQYTREAA